MLLVVLFGYFFTVRPVFQLQLLEEQTAKLQLDAALAKEELALTEQQMAQAKEELDRINKALAAATIERIGLQQALQLAVADAQSAIRQAAAKETQLAEASSQLESTERALQDAKRREFRVHVATNYVVAMTYEDISVRPVEWKNGAFIHILVGDWPNPYQILMNEIQNVSAMFGTRIQLSDVDLEYLRSHFEARRLQLTCTTPDAQALGIELDNAIRAKETEVRAKTEKYVAEVRRDYAKPWRPVRITPEFQESVARNYRETAEYEAAVPIYTRIVDERRNCLATGLMAINDLRW